MKGGSGNSGRVPDPNALRRERDDGDWLTLPAARKGNPPTWPLAASEKSTHTRELVVWAGEWRRPQATMWERFGQEIEVALYVRCLVRAEQVDAPSSLVAEVRRMQESLGLSLPGLARNKWRIGSAPVAPRVPQTASARDALKLVAGDA